MPFTKTTLLIKRPQEKLEASTTGKKQPTHNHKNSMPSSLKRMLDGAVKADLGT
jgi:hypothetical protein